MGCADELCPRTLVTMCNPVPMPMLARGTYRGYRWEVRHAGCAGFRCGYVRVPPDHPWYGIEGLSIMARAYGGAVTLADSSLGGLKVTLILPRVDA